MIAQFLRQHHFLLRRLHSLTGIVPVGGYLLIHFFINSQAIRGSESFHAAVRFVNSLPLVHWLEVLFIFIPLYFHAIYGIYIAAQSRHNVTNYGYGRNWAFFLQRMTGIITLIYVTVHLWQFRIPKSLGAFGPYEGGDSMSGLPTYDVVHAAMSANWVALFTSVGVVSAVYHLCNGVSTFLITWGITVGPKSQRASQWVTGAAFVAISAWGLAIIFAFR